PCDHLLSCGGTVEHDGDKVLADELGLIPQRADTALTAAVSGTAKDLAAARAPDEQWFILGSGLASCLGEVGLPRNLCPLRLTGPRLDEPVQSRELVGGHAGFALCRAASPGHSRDDQTRRQTDRPSPVPCD